MVVQASEVLRISSRASLVAVLLAIQCSSSRRRPSVSCQPKFEEAVFGAEKEIHYNREVTCKTCSGSGAKPGTSPVTCGRCHGHGVINVDTQTPLGMMRRQVTCDVCHGTGQEIKEPCQTCHGTGHEKQSHKYLSRFQQVLKQVNKSVLLVKVKLVSMVDLMEISL